MALLAADPPAVHFAGHSQQVESATVKITVCSFVLPDLHVDALCRLPVTSRAADA